MSRKDTEYQRKTMSKLYRGTQIFKPLNTGRIDEHVSCIREWIANIFFYTKDGKTIMIDAGYSFIAMLAESNKVAKESLRKLEINLRMRNRKIAVITGHTGWSDNLDFVFAHRDKLCSRLHKRVPDPTAPYDGYDESDDTEEKARTIPLAKKK